MVSLLLLLLIAPFLQRGFINLIILMLITISVLISGVYAISDQKKHIIIAVILCIPIIIGTLVKYFFIENIPDRLTLGLLFFFYITIIISKHVFTSAKVTSDTIYGAVSVYLLLGVIWAGGYNLLNFISPGTIDFGSHQDLYSSDRGLEMIYFSFTTLTTLGYGDISPVSHHARMLAVLEAVAGQLYIAIVIARFVGLYRNDSSRTD